MSDRFQSLPLRRIFLSCVSHEFRSYRDILASNLQLPGVELRRQEDFVNSGSTTLEKVDDYIRTCDVVIHLVGNSTGACPPRAAVRELLQRCPDIVKKFNLDSLMKPPGISYTQWEAWLSLYYCKALMLFRATDAAERELGFVPDTDQSRRQQLHWKHLRSLGRDRKEFVSPHDLSIEVLRALPLLVPGFSDNVRRGGFRDRNLLFAVLALQDEILTHSDFVKVCTLWAADTDQSIVAIMENEGLLSAADRQLVESRLERRLKARGGDVRASLAESLGGNVLNSLGEALDSGTLASLPDRAAAISRLTLATGQWRYKLVRTQGCGGLGVVSVAFDTLLDRDVAVKQLRSERMLDPMAVERFIREARITGRLQHPNIVPIYELGLKPDDQIPFYAMRFISHHTLQDVVTRHYADKAISESDRNVQFRELLQFFLSVCNAVAFAHDQGIIHRDLKPANVMIGDFGEVILLDWGLAKRIDETEATAIPEQEAAEILKAGQTQAGIRLGSPAYMAPEQAAGRIDLHGIHTDIYCLGATLYEILTGVVPFTGATPEELLSAIQFTPLCGPRKQNPRLDPALAAICAKAMEKRPEDRYQSVKHLAGDIQHWLADEQASVYVDPVAVRLQRIARRNPGPTGAIAAAILVGLIGYSLMIYSIGVERENSRFSNAQNEISAKLSRIAELDKAAMDAERRAAIQKISAANRAVELAESNALRERERAAKAEEKSLNADSKIAVAERARRKAEESLRSVLEIQDERLSAKQSEIDRLKGEFNSMAAELAQEKEMRIRDRKKSKD